MSELPTKAEMIRRLYGYDVTDHVKRRPQGGQQIAYLEWHAVNGLLDEVTGGNWDGYVADRQLIADRMVITYRIVLHCADGDITREATGGEEEDMKGYGDFMSNAEAMAFKRAAARLGLGLSLYAKDSDARRPMAQPQARAATPTNGASKAAVPSAGDREALLGEFKVARVDAAKAGFEIRTLGQSEVRAMSDDQIRLEIKAMREMTAIQQSAPA